MRKIKRQVQKALAIATIGASATFLYPHIAAAQIPLAKTVTQRHFARSFAVKNSLVHHHRGGHKLSHSHKTHRS